MKTIWNLSGFALGYDELPGKPVSADQLAKSAVRYALPALAGLGKCDEEISRQVLGWLVELGGSSFEIRLEKVSEESDVVRFAIVGERSGAISIGSIWQQPAFARLKELTGSCKIGRLGPQGYEVASTCDFSNAASGARKALVPARSGWMVRGLNYTLAPWVQEVLFDLSAKQRKPISLLSSVTDLVASGFRLLGVSKPAEIDETIRPLIEIGLGSGMAFGLRFRRISSEVFESRESKFADRGVRISLVTSLMWGIEGSTGFRTLHDLLTLRLGGVCELRPTEGGAEVSMEFPLHQ
jgi:hypothetical protein